MLPRLEIFKNSLNALFCSEKREGKPAVSILPFKRSCSDFDIYEHISNASLAAIRTEVNAPFIRFMLEYKSLLSELSD